MPGGQFADRTDAQIRVMTDDGTQIAIERGADGRYVDGRLFYTVDGSLVSVTFDADTLVAGNRPETVVDDVLVTSAASLFSLTKAGSLVYVPRVPAESTQALVHVSRDGRVLRSRATDRPYFGPRFSPGGSSVLLHDGWDIWTYDLTAGAPVRRTFDGSSDWPIWTSNGDEVLFVSSSLGPRNMFMKSARGRVPARRILESELPQWPAAVTSDGQTLVYNELHPATGGDIWTMALGNESKPSPLLQSEATTWAQGVFDDRWLLYVSNETGRFEVYVTTLPNGEEKWRISSEGGTEPVWSRTGGEIFYREGSRMMAVSITMSPQFSAGQPEILFEGHYLHCCAGLAQYDVAPDGQSFLMIRGPETNEIRLVLR